MSTNNIHIIRCEKVGQILVTVILIFSALLISSCQEDVFQVDEPPPEEAFKSRSPIADLLEKTSLNDGSPDNIIDHSSCLTVKLPVTVIVKGVELIISTEEDYVEIEKILDASADDEDTFEIVFPITIILSDYEEIEVENNEDLAELAKDCLEDGIDDDIECLDFKYPLTFSVFDSDNQVADVIIVNDDKELHEFLESLEENDFVSLNFPITVILNDGEEIVVNDNNELESLIENVGDDCDEDDDNDFNEDDVDDSELIVVLTEGSWKVTYFFDAEDKTQQFDGLIFKFKPNGSVLVSNGAKIFEGEWNTFGDDGILEIELDFDSDKPIDEIDQEWRVLDFNPDIVQLIDESGGDDSSEFLTFERTVVDDEPINTVSDFIVEGFWKIASFVVDDVNLTSNYSEYNLDFSEDSKILATDGIIQVHGVWVESFHNENHRLELDFESSDLFEDLNDEWMVVEFTETRVSLESTGGSDLKDKLVMERIE